MGKKILTLNIGTSAVVLAEYEASGARLTLQKYGMAPLEAPLDAANAATVLPPALLQIVRERGIRPGKVAVSVAGQMVFPRLAAIPAAGGSERFEQLVRYEIESNVPFPIDEMVCDRQILGDTPQGDKSVLVVAAKTEQIEALTSAIASVGFVPEIVDVAPLALANLLEAAAPEGGCAVILDLGSKTTSLVIAEGEKFYNRSIPVAGATLTKDLAQKLGCSFDEAEGVKRESAYVSMGGVTEDEDPVRESIAKVCRTVMTRLHAEISRSINFYRSQQGGSTPAKIYLTGGTSLLPQLPEFFQDSLGVEVEYLDPFAVVRAGAAIDAEAAAADGVLLAPTAGVALHAAGMARIAVNLMPESLVRERAESRRIPFVAVAAAGLVAALGCAYFAAGDKTAGWEDRVAAVRAEADRLEGVKQRVTAARKRCDEAAAAAGSLARRIAARGDLVGRLEIARGAIEPDWGKGLLWISSWQDTVREEEVAAPSRPGGVRRAPEKRTVRKTRMTVRGWGDDIKRFEAAFAQNGDDDTKANWVNILQNRLIASGAFEDGAVTVPQTPKYGKDGCLRECVIEMQFKEPQCK